MQSLASQCLLVKLYNPHRELILTNQGGWMPSAVWNMRMRLAAKRFCTLLTASLHVHLRFPTAPRRIRRTRMVKVFGLLQAAQFTKYRNNYVPAIYHVFAPL